MTTVTTNGLRDIDGELLLPGEAGYDEARTLWNAMVDRRPRMIVRCASVEDVVASVRTARDNDLEIGIRCGGHSVLGLSVPDGGLMIDLTPLGAVTVDPARRRAWVQGGALLGALDLASQHHGLATTAGNVSHTGVGGLTLGGGMGWLARQYGLSCDNVVSFTVVTADGEVVRAAEDEHPDLYWGLRGGGGNFGVVTEFEFQLHAVGTRTLVADYSFPLGEALPVMRGWRDLNAQAPRQATFFSEVGRDNLVRVGLVWVGDPAEAQPFLPALRALGRPVAHREVEMSYVDLQRKVDHGGRHGLRRYSKGHYLRQFPDEAIEAYLLRGSENGRGELLPSVDLQAYGGAIAEVPDEDTAFSHRGTLFEFGTSTNWVEPGEDEARLAGARAAAAALEPFASGVYVNVLADEGAEGVNRAYPPATLARLRAIKRTYDPLNVFHLNQNIKPA